MGRWQLNLAGRCADSTRVDNSGARSEFLITAGATVERVGNAEERRARGDLLFFIGDIGLVEVVDIHGLLHMTRTKKLQEVSLELIGEV